MAAVLGITEGRLRQLVPEGMPRLGRGTYPLKGCVQWYVRYWKDKAENRGGTDPERREGQTLKNQIARAKLEEATGHLIPRKDVMQVWTSAYLRLGKWLDGLASSLAREAGLNTDTARILRSRLDEAREDFARDSQEYIEPPEGGKADAKKRA